MRRILSALVFSLLSTMAYAQQWDQVNGSMQVRSGPTSPLVIIDQTASGQTILSLRANGTEACSVTATAFTCTGSFTFGVPTLAVDTLKFDVANQDVSLSREAAATLQIGSDAAGVTNQMFKGPDRITSDGVGGNLTIAGGRNRGASAGGSIIFQTSPAAGAGVTGTLATALAIDSTGAFTTVGKIATLGAIGVPAVVAVGRVTAQSAANASISTFTVGAADASFEVSANMNVTASTALTTTLTCTYTDESNTARTMILPVASLAGSFIAAGAITGAGASVWETPVMHIRAKAATAITILTSAGTFTGVTYTAEGVIKQTK